jgi:hypothetical protein
VAAVCLYCFVCWAMVNWASTGQYLEALMCNPHPTFHLPHTYCMGFWRCDTTYEDLKISLASILDKHGYAGTKWPTDLDRPGLYILSQGFQYVISLSPWFSSTTLLGFLASWFHTIRNSTRFLQFSFCNWSCHVHTGNILCLKGFVRYHSLGGRVTGRVAQQREGGGGGGGGGRGGSVC